MTNERQLVANLFSAALAFDDAQGAEYAAGEPAHSAEASARTASAGRDLFDAYVEFQDSIPGGVVSRESLKQAGLRDHEIDFIAVQMVQAPFEVDSNEQVSETVAHRGDVRERAARSVATELTRNVEDTPPGHPAPGLEPAPGGISTESVRTTLREQLGEELRAAQLLAPSDSAVNTSGVMKATLGNTLERETLVELPGHKVRFEP